MTHAYATKLVVPVTSIEMLDDVTVLSTTCISSDEFNILPKAVLMPNVGKTVFVKTGWNSDTNKAYYRDDQTYASAVLG